MPDQVSETESHPINAVSVLFNSKQTFVNSKQGQASASKEPVPSYTTSTDLSLKKPNTR